MDTDALTAGQHLPPATILNREVVIAGADAYSTFGALSNGLECAGEMRQPPQLLHHCRVVAL